MIGKNLNSLIAVPNNTNVQDFCTAVLESPAGEGLIDDDEFCVTLNGIIHIFDQENNEKYSELSNMSYEHGLLLQVSVQRRSREIRIKENFGKSVK